MVRQCLLAAAAIHPAAVCEKWFLFFTSKILVVYYCKCFSLIGYATRYVFVDRYRVAASNATRQSFFLKKTTLISFSKQFWSNNAHKFVFTKTIRLLALNFYEAIVNSGFALVNYPLNSVENQMTLNKNTERKSRGKRTMVRLIQG